MRKHGLSILLIIMFIVCTLSGQTFRWSWLPNDDDTEFYVVQTWQGADTNNVVWTLMPLDTVVHDFSDPDHWREDLLRFVTDQVTVTDGLWYRGRIYAGDSAGNRSAWGYSPYYFATPVDTIAPAIPAGFIRIFDE